MSRIKIKYILSNEGQLLIGQRITVKGWVRAFRSNRFIQINDGSCLSNIQAVIDFEKYDEGIINQITTAAAVSVSGILVASIGTGQSVELQADAIEIIGAAHPDEVQKTVLQPKKHSLELLRKQAHLRFRTNTFSAVFRIRHNVAYAIHHYFHEKGFYYLHTPIITGSDAEGAGEMFHVSTLDPLSPPLDSDGNVDYKQDFFGRPVNLTVSGQLEAELAALALGQVYTFGPTFRAENSNTSRHLAEFWMIEPEVAFNDLKDNKVLFIFYPYLRKNNNFPSMEELKLKLESLTEKTGICYNSQTDDKVIKTLKDVNTTWKNYNFVLTNTKITVGVNYDKQHFDKVYLSVAGFSSTRDIIQVSCRCRTLNTNSINVCYFEKYNTAKAFINDNELVVNCPIYKQLVKNVIIEKVAPLKGSFLLFCEKAGYKIKINKEILDAKLSEYITNLFMDSDIEYTFNTIPDITINEVDEIQKKTYALNSTLEEKLSLQKFYFKNKFINGADIDNLCLGWDNRYNLFFDKIANFIFEDNHILLKNSKYNNWLNIFPDDKQLNNIKMDDIIIDVF